MSKSTLLPIEKTVRRALQKSFPHSTPSLITGVSGGADSMVLLHILHKFEVSQYVVHVNYQKRGDEADKDAELVKQTAQKLRVDYKTIRVTPEEAEGKNFQQWARQVRYNAFEIQANQTGADGIAVGHHRDDQIETIIQKIFRGGGLASWSGMQVWNGRLFRPLLGVTRKQIVAYCKEKKIIYRSDKSNFESDFARNFLRNEWLTELEDHFPGWRTNILRVAEQAAVFKSSLQYILENISDDYDRLLRGPFLALDDELQKSILIHYVHRLDPDQHLSRGALRTLGELAELQTGKSVQLTDDMQLMRDREYFKIVVDTNETAASVTLEKKKLDDGFSFNDLIFSLKPFESPDFEQMLYLDSNQISWPLKLRRWRPGDRLQPLGMEGHQSVADHLTNRKIPAAEKEKALVLESFEESICAVIFPTIKNQNPPGTISDWAKCRSSTESCLTISRNS